MCREAYEYARAAHHGPDRRGDTDISHPLAVAVLLSEAGFGESVIAAGLLHDVVEDTARVLEEIETRFGTEVATLVRGMTEEESIEPYGARKAEHRARVLDHSRDAAAIYAADKLARVRAYEAVGEEIGADRREHYVRTLELFDRRRPDLPFLDELRELLTPPAEADRGNGDGVAYG